MHPYEDVLSNSAMGPPEARTIKVTHKHEGCVLNTVIDLSETEPGLQAHIGDNLNRWIISVRFKIAGLTISELVNPAVSYIKEDINKNCNHMRFSNQ